MDIEYKKKITLVGANAVGKTSLINQFVNQMFSERYLSTIEANIYTKYVGLDINGNQYQVKLVIVDTAGTISDELLKKNSSGSDGVMFVFDLTRGYTLDILKNRIVNSQLDNIPSVFIGNKTDLIDEFLRESRIDDIAEAHIDPELKGKFNIWMQKKHYEVIDFYEREYGIIPQFDPFLVKKVGSKYVGPLDEMVDMIYTSAKENKNVDLAFTTISKAVIKHDPQYRAVERKLAKMLE